MCLSGYSPGVVIKAIIQNTFSKKQARKVQRTNYREIKPGKPSLQMRRARNVQVKYIMKGMTIEVRQRK